MSRWTNTRPMFRITYVFESEAMDAFVQDFRTLQEANAALAARVRELEEVQGELLGIIGYYAGPPYPYRPDPNAKPDPDCKNCDGAGCMGCVSREWGHECVKDCPICCPWIAA